MPASASAACLPIGTALVTEFPSQFMSIYGSRAREPNPPAPPVPRADQTARPALRLPADIANLFFREFGSEEQTMVKAAAAPFADRTRLARLAVLH
jgi:hypothetical protein